MNGIYYDYYTGTYRSTQFGNPEVTWQAALNVGIRPNFVTGVERDAALKEFGIFREGSGSDHSLVRWTGIFEGPIDWEWSKPSHGSNGWGSNGQYYDWSTGTYRSTFVGNKSISTSQALVNILKNEELVSITGESREAPVYVGKGIYNKFGNLSKVKFGPLSVFYMPNDRTVMAIPYVDVNGGSELTYADIQNLASQLRGAPSGQDVIEFISNVNNKYLNAFVTGQTLKNSVPGITDDALTSLGKIDRITKSGSNIVISGSTQIKILPVLKLNIADGATFTISKLTSNQSVIDVTGIKVGWLNFNRVIVNPTSVIINVGGINTTWDLK